MAAVLYHCAHNARPHYELAQKWQYSISDFYLWRRKGTCTFIYYSPVFL